MILHFGILALLLGSIISLMMILYASWTGIVIIRNWDFSSSSARQLALERRTYLVSTLVNFSLGLFIAAIVLFVYTVDDIHPLFVGAMCATGSLNVNPVGWYALAVKIAVFFLAGFWIALNRLDQSLEQYPLVRLKYLLLLVLVPVLAVDLYLMASYFLGLEPAVITSCCGSLFGAGDETAIASLNALPAAATMAVFWLCWLASICLLALARHYHRPLFSGLASLAGAVFFVVAFVAIISFVSPYVYELPTHHCPFDMLQRGYGYIGYPLYLSLFAGVYYALMSGIFLPLYHVSGLEAALAVRQRAWQTRAIIWLILFAALVAGIVLNSNLTLL